MKDKPFSPKKSLLTPKSAILDAFDLKYGNGFSK